MKLVIGAGERRVKGFQHHDVQPLEGLDYVCDIWDLPLNVAPGTCDEIQLTHVLEHFPMAKTDDVLRLLHGLLKENGKLYIEVPNFAWHAKMILEDPFNEQMVEYVFGGQLNEWDYHYTGFTPELLMVHLADTGFFVEGIEPNSSIKCKARKV